MGVSGPRLLCTPPPSPHLHLYAPCTHPELNEIDIRKQHDRESRSAPGQQAMASAAGYNGTGGATVVYVVQAPAGQQYQGYPGQGYPGYPPVGYPVAGEGYVAQCTMPTTLWT